MVGVVFIKKGFYYLVLTLLWVAGVLLLGLLLILLGAVPTVVSWSYAIGRACADPLVWLISLCIVLLLRPMVHKFVFKEKKAFSRTLPVVFLVLGSLLMAIKIGSAVLQRRAMEKLSQRPQVNTAELQSKPVLIRHSDGSVTMNGKKGQVVYSLTLPNGKRKGINESVVNKNGWDKYAKMFDGATLDMKDEQGKRYNVPLGRVNDAVAGGLSPFSTFFSNEEWNRKRQETAKKNRKNSVDVSQWLAQKAKPQDNRITTYQVTGPDGKKQAVRKSDVEKYGWDGYSKAYPEYSLRMQNGKGDFYNIPLGKVEYALTKGFKPYGQSTLMRKKSQVKPQARSDDARRVEPEYLENLLKLK